MATNQNLLRRLQLASWLALGLLWLLPLLYFNQLPAELPTHFDSTGTPTSWAAKHHLFWLPVLGLVFQFGFMFLHRAPANWNTGNWGTAQNEQQLQLGQEMLKVIQVISMFSFLYLTWASIQTGLGNQSGLAAWFGPAFGLVLTLTIVYYLAAHVMAGRA